jgi:hypothetical protein
MKTLRRVEPEWLDELPPQDPRATRSRRDLQRINALMMNDTIVARELAHGRSGRPLGRIAEIGAGDGTFMLRLAAKIKTRTQHASVVLLDRQDIVTAGTLGALASLGWTARSITADVFEWLAQPAAGGFDAIIANLFLHHFDDAQLSQLLALAAERAPVFVACEPRRSGLALAASRLLAVVGCNDVSRHDAVISVRAGFTGHELSALWPARRGWAMREFARGLFSHCFVAFRHGGASLPGGR